MSSFGVKKNGLHNDGVNIAAPRGAAVRAADNGVVAYAGKEIRGFGNLLLIKHDGGLYRVRKAQSVKPGKGGTYNQLELTDMRTGTKTSARFRSSETVEQAQFDPPEKYQLLYNDGEKLALMHNTTFEQVELEVSLVPTDALPFLEDGMDIVLLTIEGEPFDVELPSTASCIVAETPPNMKGATQTAQFKPATLENGVVVKVPAFVETGDTIVVKVQGGIDYLERV